MKKVNVANAIRIVGYVFLALIFLLFFSTKFSVAGDAKCIKISDDAKLYYNDKMVFVGNTSDYTIVNPKFGDELVIEKKIKESDIKNAAIGFNDNLNLGFTVEVDGKVVKSHGMKAKEDSIVCNNFVIIPLGEEIEGKTVRITFRCINEGILKELPEVVCMNNKDLIHLYLNTYAEYIIVAALLIEVGLLLLIFMCMNVMLKIFNMKNIYIALVGISVGVWILSCFQINMIILNNYVVDFYLEYLALAVTIVFSNKYVQEMYRDDIEKKVLKICNISLIIVTAIAVVLQATNTVYMDESLIFIQIHAFPIILLLMKKYFTDAKDKKLSSWLILGETIAVCFGVIFYIVIDMTVSRDSTNILNVIILIYVILIIQSMYKIVVEMKNAYISNAESKSISRLAYMDTLTGISNRRGLDKYIEKINKMDNNNVYVVCSFDLNRLKYTNDTYGHAAGDTLIKSFANELQGHIDSELEFCGRMGGDEFIAVILKERAKAVLNKLKNDISEKNNNGEYKYKLNYSVGTSEYINNKENDVHESLKLADSLMYEMKSSYN